MSGLIVPESVVKAEMAKQQERIKDAFVLPENRVLDPTKLPESALERLPQPTGWRILILPYRGKDVTAGGIYKPQESVERYALATVVGYVLKMGPDCYKDTQKFPGGPWCKEREWVIIGRYAGARFKIEGGEVRIINDDEVIGTIKDPEDVMHV
jgi:co-chaperonin GroES (HSP10)